jgi:hypothetical protein
MQNMWRSPEFDVIPTGEEARLLFKGGDKWPIPDYETLIGTAISQTLSNSQAAGELMADIRLSFAVNPTVYWVGVIV